MYGLPLDIHGGYRLNAKIIIIVKMARHLVTIWHVLLIKIRVL